MAVKNSSNHTQEGQALFEFIIFIPFFLLTYSLVLSIGSSINGAINQQKVTRGYFFARTKNNSTIPTPQELDLITAQSAIGMTYVGWRSDEQNQVPIAPCYKLTQFNLTTPDACLDDYTGTSTQQIRVKTVFGLCGATYSKQGGRIQYLPAQFIANRGGCAIR